MKRRGVSRTVLLAGVLTVGMVVAVALGSAYLFPRQPTTSSTATSSQQSSTSYPSSSFTKSVTITSGTQKSTTSSSLSQTTSTPSITTSSYSATQTTSYTTQTTSYTAISQTSYYINTTQTTTQRQSSGLPDCGTQMQFFTVPPLNYSDFTGIVPLGNLNPPQHVLPVDHLYFDLKFVYRSQNGSQSSWLTEKVPVLAPGNLTILQISSNNASPTHTDYLLYFWPCGQFYGYYDHVTSLSPSLQALFTPPFDRCQQYSGFSNGTSCTKYVHVQVQAGQYLGTAGGVQNGSTALDFGAVDMRVPPLAYSVPSHYYSFQLQKVCAIDYYPPSVADLLRSRLGSYDGSVRRTAQPVCGSINQDISGTAQGNWFGQGMVLPVQDESQAIALVHDNVNVSRGVFSIGSSMTNLGLQPGTYYFSPTTSGLVNVDFQYVKPGQVYCYETSPHFSAGYYTKTVIIIQLLDSSTLRIESLASTSGASCGTRSWTFSSNHADFRR